MPSLLIFARQPVLGRVKTRLAASIGDAAACRLYRAFLQDLCAQLAPLTQWQIRWWVDGDPKALRAAVTPLWRQGWTAHRQPAGDLGERLQAGFAHAFAADPGPVGVVGSDCPQLGTEQLESLFAPLAGPADAALLPAEDGGYAGLSLGAPAPEAFQEIDWSTPRVADQTLARLHGAGRRVSVLPPVFDVDTVAELRRLHQLLRDAPGRAPYTAAVLAQTELPEAG